MTKRSVFLSSSARDSALTARVEVALEGLGFDAFNPMNDLRPGDDWRKSIQAAIRRSEALLLVVASPDAAASSWMAYETGVAEALGKQVILLVPEIYPFAQLPPDLRAQKVLRLDPHRPDRTARDVAERLTAADA